ncbi:hypothetical protein GGI07_001410 [Coemansia sp. Benny D115]|nr:hypothetical protein GGI07_001410 [Coemansia sp. Benny D115]
MSVLKTAAKSLSGRTPLSLYVHWPYCSFLCRFCAFSKAKVPASGINHDRITSALIREMRTVLQPHKNKALHSIYFGGGTPSLARPEDIGKIIQQASDIVPLVADAEITLESNPTLAEIEKMRGFRAAGVNRYSIGVQTLNDKWLRDMNRGHTGMQGLEAVDRAREVFPGRVAFDMIFGFSGQTLDAWQSELGRALEHADGHMSIYQLTVEPGTPLFRDHRAQRIVLPDDDVQAQMYEAAVGLCKEHGMHHYEVSSYARSEESQGKHNRGYWYGHEYVGVGPSAHSRFVDPGSGRRIGSIRVPDTRRWEDLCGTQGHGTGKEWVIRAEEAKQEAVVFGLRMAEGITDKRFRSLSGGQGLEEYLCMDRVREYAAQGLLDWTSAPGPATATKRLKPTEKGLQIIDSILLDVTP